MRASRVSKPTASPPASRAPWAISRPSGPPPSTREAPLFAAYAPISRCRRSPSGPSSSMSPSTQTLRPGMEASESTAARTELGLAL